MSPSFLKPQCVHLPTAMNTSNLSSKTFSLRQANQMLPLVQSITEDVVELFKEVSQTRERLHELGKVRITTQDSEQIYRNEVLSIEVGVQEQNDALDGYIQELADLGLVIDRVVDGFVDFPAVRMNERIYLCWRLGEPEVRFWRYEADSVEERIPVDLELIRQSGDHATV